MGYTFEDFINDPSVGRIVIISIVTIPLCILATVLRLLAPKPDGQRIRWDDIFAVLALVGHIGYAVSPFILVGSAVRNDLTDLQIARLSAKVAYIVTPFFYINQLFVRGSLFVLYYRIFWSNRTFVRWIYALATVHVCWFITFFFMVLFLCNPVREWWDIEGTVSGTCIDGNLFLVTEETINSSLDLAMIVLTVAIVQKLPTRSHVKAKLAFIFLIGGLSGILGFVKIGIVYSQANTNGQENDTNGFWDILQMTTSIFCACAPMFKTMLPLAGLWIRVKSSISRSMSERSQRFTGTMSTPWTDKSRSHAEEDDETGVSQFAFRLPRFLGGPPAQLSPELEAKPLYPELGAQGPRPELEPQSGRTELDGQGLRQELETVENPVQLPTSRSNKKKTRKAETSGDMV